MLEYSYDDKDNSNDSNNNICNAEDDKYSQNSEDQIRPKNNEIPEFIFSVIKLGRRGFSHKTRLLCLNKDGISYYRMVDKNENTKEFLDCLKSIYVVRTGDDIDIEKLRELARKFRNLPEDEKSTIIGLINKFSSIHNK